MGGENQTVTLPADVVFKLIEGHARIEAKLDAHVTSEASYDRRLGALEGRANQAEGVRKTLIWLVPIISGLVAMAATAVVYAITAGRYLEKIAPLLKTNGG